VANFIKMAIVQAIFSLHAQGLSGRQIARTLRIGRGTVARHLRRQRLADSNRAIAPIEPGPVGAAPNGAIAPTGSGAAAASTEPAPPRVTSLSLPSTEAATPSSARTAAGRLSKAAPWKDFILQKHAQGLSAKRIHQDLRDEPGADEVGYDSVRRLLKMLCTSRALPYRRMECAPGQEAQVDFGAGARIVMPDGKRRKTHVLRVVLSHSRKAYSEACFRQSAEDFLRVLENAFWQLGGVPRTVVVDNLKAAVLQADWFDPDLNPKLQSFAQHYGTVILPTKPRTPRHKGKVERGVGYVQDNGLKGRDFASLEAQNQHLTHWEATVADTRIHGTTKRHVGQVFRELEQAALLPLPGERFPFFHEAQRKVNRDGHIELAKAYYSTPPEYLGRTVWARWDARLVRIFNQRFEQIALHVRHEPGKFSTLGEHIVPEKISGVERGAAWLLNRIRSTGPQAHAWAEAMLTSRGIEGLRVLQGLLALEKRHAPESLEKACETALSYGAYRLRTIRKLLSRDALPQQPLPFLDEHPIIRPLDDYGRIVAAALQRQEDRSSRSEGFERHGWTKATAGRAHEKSPHLPSPASSGSAELLPPRSGYPSPGCASAEPGSVSPDSSSIVPPPSFPQETDDE
jgi:transposase